MSLEIEKKYLVAKFDEILNKLSSSFGKFDHKIKKGFWWCNNFSGIESVLDINDPKLFKKEVAVIKDIGEFTIPVQDYQYVRLRIVNDNIFMVTFKIKSLVNNIEQNTEYEFSVDKDLFDRLAHFLKDTSLIFYFNIKESWEFMKDDIKIEISKFNDQKDSFVEIEITGNKEEQLSSKLEDFIKDYFQFNLKEEPRNYCELSHQENREKLRRIKLSQYSRDAFKKLQEDL